MQVSSLRSYGVCKYNESLNWPPRHFKSYSLLHKSMCTKIGESRIFLNACNAHKKRPVHESKEACLCLIETRIHHASTNVHKFINSSKYSYISIHDDQGLMMMYDMDMHLDSFDTIINDGLKYIIKILNINTQKKKTYCMCV